MDREKESGTAQEERKEAPLNRPGPAYEEELKEVACGSTCGIRFSLQTTQAFSVGDVIQLHLNGFTVKQSLKNAPVLTNTILPKHSPRDIKLRGGVQRIRSRASHSPLHKRNSTEVVESLKVQVSD